MTHASVVILVLLAAHFVADFVCQTHWQAVNKSRSLTALTRHVLGYSLVLFGIASMLAWPRSVGGAPLAFFGITFAAHWCTDLATSRVNASLWSRTEIDPDEWTHWFFVSVGFDQLLHQAQIIGTAAYLGLI